MISGTRKPPPISTSSPRDTITSRPRASAAEREQHRGRVVVHDEPGLGAARAREQRAGVLVARAARRRCRGGTRGSSSPPPTAVAARAPSSPSGARPRLVCSSTPVAFTTGGATASPATRDPRRGVGDDGVGVDARRSRRAPRRRLARSRRAAVAAAASVPRRDHVREGPASVVDDPVDRQRRAARRGSIGPTYNMKVKVRAMSPHAALMRLRGG